MWVVIERDDPGVRDRVYNLEGDLLLSSPEEMDFRLVALDGREVSTVVPSAAVLQ